MVCHSQKRGGVPCLGLTTKQPFLITKREGRGNGRVCTVNYTFIALPGHKFLPQLLWTERSLTSHSLSLTLHDPNSPCFPKEMNDKSVERISALESPRSITLNDFITLVWLLYQNPGSPSRQWRLSPHCLVAGLAVHFITTRHQSLQSFNETIHNFYH